MKTLYLQCAMGAAGDMLMAALYELLDEQGRAEFLTDMNALGLPGVRVSAAAAQKCGIWGTQIKVVVYGEEEHSHDVYGHEHGDHDHHDHSHSDHDHSHGEHDHSHGEHDHSHGEHDHSHGEHDHSHGEHDHSHGEHDHSHGEHDHSHGEHDHSHGEHDHGDHDHDHAHHDHHHTHSHSGMADIAHLLSHLPVSEQVRKNAEAVYDLIAQAESHAHGQPVSEIHFHEVGTLDAVADVVGVCMLMERIGAQKVLASPVHVGSGQVRCAHGILPVPAPATAHILEGVPCYGGAVQGELCTPTGAALLKHFAESFGAMPVMTATAVGYGMGTKDFEAANCVRAFLGEDGAGKGGPNGEVAVLCCNLDDITGEALGFAEEAFFAAGALDVFTLPIQMKKNRPGVLLCCICEESAADKLAAAMLSHTSTFGVRKSICPRYMLSRSFSEVQTRYGTVRIKTGTGYGVEKSKPEYEDIARIAREQNLPLGEVIKELR